MTNFTIQIPYGRRDESLAVVASRTRLIETTDDARVMRQVVFDAMERNGAATTAGDLIDELAAMDPAQRRQLLDQARVECGLPTATDVEARQRLELLAQGNRAAVHSGLQGCHAEGCTAVPVMSTGTFAVVDVKRWHCPAHEHLAAEGDMEPRGHNLRISPSGSLVEYDPREEARDAERAESRRAQLASQAADREVEAAERRASNQARDRAHRRELPDYMREPAA